MFNSFEIIKNANLSKFSTIKIGGRAKYMLFPKTVSELKKILKIAQENNIKTQIIGNGSNVLFDDRGFDGAIVSLKHFDNIEFSNEKVIVGAGVNLFKLNAALKNHELSGIEWSFGIPATIGGFVFVNGGSFGHEICEVVDEVRVLRNGKISTIKRKKIDFGYRFSNIDGIILQVVLKLKRDDSEKIEKRMMDFLEKKKQSQPCDMPSLGSVFKRIVSKSGTVMPAKMIDTLGLKGVKIGKAEISTTHAGFIVNLGGATSQNVKDLIALVEKRFEEYGVFVEKEIKFLEY